MGYSGFVELLCLNGHYGGHDVYESAPERCFCGAHFRWSHGVDQTNGYDESHPSSCCAPKTRIGADDRWHEDHHGNRYATEDERFAPAGDGIWLRINSKGQATPPYPDDLASSISTPREPGPAQQAPGSNHGD
jgi:hypothetical protein